MSRSKGLPAAQAEPRSPGYVWTARAERAPRARRWPRGIAEGVNSFETDRARQFRYEPVGHGAGGQRPRVADSPPGIKGPLRRLRPLTPERSSAREPLSPLPQPTFVAAGAAG